MECISLSFNIPIYTFYILTLLMLGQQHVGDSCSLSLFSVPEAVTVIVQDWVECCMWSELLKPC